MAGRRRSAGRSSCSYCARRLTPSLCTAGHQPSLTPKSRADTPAVTAPLRTAELPRLDSTVKITRDITRKELHDELHD